MNKGAISMLQRYIKKCNEGCKSSLLDSDKDLISNRNKTTKIKMNPRTTTPPLIDSGPTSSKRLIGVRNIPNIILKVNISKLYRFASLMTSKVSPRKYIIACFILKKIPKANTKKVKLLMVVPIDW